MSPNSSAYRVSMTPTTTVNKRMIASYQNLRSEITQRPSRFFWSQHLVRLQRLLQNMKPVLVSLLVAVSLISAKGYANPVLAPDYPDRYTVIEGDTLWAIAGKFLRDPWRWPEVWQGNPQVDNPDLIYPGDVLVMTFIDGRPTLRSLRRETVKLNPKARPSDHRDAISAIDPSAIQAYLSAPLVTDEAEIKQAGYVVDGISKRLLMGKYDQFYARGVEDQEADEYRIFRPGRHFVDPVSEETLGWEAEHVGDARLLKEGETARFSLLSAYLEVSIRDRLRPIYKKESLPFFYPKAPDNVNIRGHVLPTKTQTTELGALSVVAISVGEREGVQPGDVFRIKSHSVKKEDPMTGEDYFLPEEKAGLLLVFRTFAKVSYAIITNTNRPVRALDLVVSPDAD